jgi:hypothetical protein
MQTVGITNHTLRTTDLSNDVSGAFCSFIFQRNAKFTTLNAI